MIMPAGSFRNTTEGALFPTWTCIIDGVSNAPAPFIFPANRWPLCENDFLQDGQHNITLKIQVPEGQQFWFDYMQYKPSDTVPLDNANIYVDSTDSDVNYGDGWIDYDSGRGQEALTPGTSLSLKFHGNTIPVNHNKCALGAYLWICRDLHYMGRDHPRQLYS